MKKRTLTLVEVMIALGIASLLLAVLFPYLTDTIRIKKKLEIEKSYVFSKAHAQERLGILFSQMPTSSEFKTMQEEDQPLKLLFEFDNGYDHDDRFRGLVKGCLFLDSQGKLLLEIEKEEEKRSEILLENLKKIHFQFSYANKHEFEEVTVWEKDFHPLFFILHTKLLDEKEDAFYYRLNSSNHITYPSPT